MRYTRLTAAAFLAAAGLPLWAAPVKPRTAPPHTGTVQGHLLAINDFHGHIVADRTVTINGEKKPVGGAAYLAAIFRRYRAEHPNTLLVNAGDSVGGSPPLSALFQDEPTVEFLNMTGWDVGTLGNHEFDEGVPELLRLWKGGAHKASRYYPNPFPGANFPVVCANILDARTGKPLLAPYVVKRVGGVRVGFIGAVTSELPQVTSAASRKGIREIDPAQAINTWARHLAKYGVHSIVALVHEGGSQKPENPDGTLTGAIVDLARRLDPDVDVLVSAHSHQYTDKMLGKLLVTQARNYGDAFAEVDFTIDRASADIVRKSARIVPALHDGVTPAPDVAAMVARYQALAAPRIDKVVARVAHPMRRYEDAALGNLIADAQRAAMSGDIALMNPGGVRADLPGGDVTWGQLYSVQPFGNQLVALSMTGAQIEKVLEQQWGPGAGGEERTILLYPSGLSYLYDPRGTYGRRLVSVTGPDGEPLDPARTYRVVANSFLAGGGDGFTAFQEVRERENGPNDLDALIVYMQAHPDVEPGVQRVRAKF